MKNVCILLKKGIITEDHGESTLFSILYRGGYPLKEVRILSGERELSAGVTELKTKCDNLFVLAEKGLLPAVNALLSACFSAEGKEGIFEEGACTLFLLPLEDTEICERICLPYLRQKHGVKAESIILRCIGASEERIQNLIQDIKRSVGDEVEISHRGKYDERVIEVSYGVRAPKMAVDEAVRLLTEGLGDTVYAMNDVSLEEQLVRLLKIRGKRLSVAESFTGGGLAKRITSVSGASEVYFEGVNTYDERSKIKRLGVSENGLRTMGAVSDQTAYEMALGLLNTGDCDISIATTGLAGPKSDRSMLPVGLCFIAVGTKEKVYVYRYQFSGSRQEITEKAINYALFQAYKLVKNN